jgi:hypothetical protein
MGERFTLRLRGGWQMKRQLGAFGQIVRGEAIPGELALYRVRANGSDHRNGMQDRSPGGGQRQYWRIMAKLVAWLPRQPAKERKGRMIVRTQDDCFCRVACPGREDWVLNADHVRRWVAQHRRYLQRMAEDLKFEKRWPAKVRQQMVESQERRCLKQRHRIETWCRQATATIANFADRQGVEQVEYDDSVCGYLPSFAWGTFWALLGFKLDGFGITLTASGEVVNPEQNDESTEADRPEAVRPTDDQ